MRLELGGVDGDGLVVWRFLGQSHHDPSENAHVAPTLPSVVQGFWRSMLAGASHHLKPLRLMKIIPLSARQSSTRDRPRLLGKLLRKKALHLRLAQPVKVAHDVPQIDGAVDHADVEPASQLMGPEPREALTPQIEYIYKAIV